MAAEALPLGGLQIVSDLGMWAVYAGLAAAASIAILMLAAVYLNRYSVIRRDQIGAASRSVLLFAAFLVIVGAVLLLGRPVIEASDPARLPPPTPTAANSPAAGTEASPSPGAETHPKSSTAPASEGAGSATGSPALSPG